MVELEEALVVAIAQREEKQGYLPIKFNVIRKVGRWESGAVTSGDGKAIMDALRKGEVDISQVGHVSIESEKIQVHDAAHYDIVASLCQALSKTSQKTARLDQQLAKTLPLLKATVSKTSQLTPAKAQEISNKRKMTSAVSSAARSIRKIEKGLK